MVYDIENICRVCLSEGVMMSIFKVNISKKIMACSSVQVWQNDGLPSKICNKCVAKLHIAFQFKKQCEKSDAKLRLYLNNSSNNESDNQVQTIETHATENNCVVYNDCVQKVEIPNHDIQQEQQTCRYDAMPTTTVATSVLPEINYSTQTMNMINGSQESIHIQTYDIQAMNHVQFHPYNVQELGGVNQVQLPVTTTNNILPSTTLNLGQVQLCHPVQNGNIEMSINHPSSTVIDQRNMADGTTNLSNKESNEKVKKKKVKQNDDVNNNKQCITCGKMFSTSIKLSRHVKTHSNDLPFKCKLCNKAFAHSGNYKIHLRMHTDERPFGCNVCGKGCRQAQDLEKHMRTHTGERPHRCTMCPRAFSTSSNLIAHIRTHTGEKPYVCCVCQKAFCQSNELTKHMRTHTGEKSHSCSVCHKEFNGSSTLIVHMRTHTGEKPYVCSKCNKSFAQSSCLTIHMKRHAGEKNYHCGECKRGFVVSSDLKEHMLTHSGEKPYICNICDKRFSRINDLNKHSKAHAISQN